jgi:predicted HNH restriction endonuclease
MGDNDSDLQAAYAKALSDGTPAEQVAAREAWLQAYIKHEGEDRGAHRPPESGKRVFGVSEVASRSGQLSLAAIEATQGGRRPASLEEIKEVLRSWGDSGNLWKSRGQHFNRYMVEQGWATFDDVKKVLTLTEHGKTLIWENSQPSSQLPEEVDAATALTEGAVCQITVNAYERNAEARRRCIEHHGTSCCICEFSFGAVYGEVAKGYIHVHHLRALSEIGGEYVVDPVADLRPVCPNCHSVLHRRIPAFSIEEVRGFLGR